MKREPKVAWWEWLILVVVLEALAPTRNGGMRWEWLFLIGVLARFV